MINQQALCDSIAKATIRTDDGEEWVLEYFLQTKGDSSEFFGLRVDKSTPDGVLVERSETAAISKCRDTVMTMINAFSKGSVPPSVLPEMTEEWCTVNGIAI